MLLSNSSQTFDNNLFYGFIAFFDCFKKLLYCFFYHRYWALFEYILCLYAFGKSCSLMILLLF